MIESIPQQASIGAAIATHVNTGVTTISALQVPTDKQTIEAPSVVQAPVAEYQYSKSTYAVIVNGLAAQLDQGAGTVGTDLARIIQNGPFGGPPPPAGVAAGIPVAPHSTNNAVISAVVSSLRSLAGNGSLFSNS